MTSNSGSNDLLDSEDNVLAMHKVIQTRFQDLPGDFTVPPADPTPIPELDSEAQQLFEPPSAMIAPATHMKMKSPRTIQTSKAKSPELKSGY